MDNGGHLQDHLRVPVQVLALADGFGESVDLHKMVDVMPVPVEIRDHFPNDFRSGHEDHLP